MIVKKESGFVFLEIVIAIALMSIVLMTLLNVSFIALNLGVTIQQNMKQNVLVREEIEAMRAFRDGSTWANFTTVNFGGSNFYYFTQSGGAWVRNSGTETVGVFTRKIVFDQVYRDGSGNIASSGTLDNETIKATVTVDWSGKTVQAVTYVTNWQNK